MAFKKGAEKIATSLKSRAKALSLGILGIYLLFSGMTFSRNRVWKDNLTLFSHDLPLLENCARAHYYYASELAKGFGFLQSKPTTSFSPVAVTPDELGSAWTGGRVHLSLQSSWNGKRVGWCEAGPEMTFHFGQLISHLCKTRRARAGSIIGSGAVSNKDWTRGYSCIADKRAIETIEHGEPQTEFMQYGDTIRIEMTGLDGHSVFGAIDQTVAPL